MNRIRTLLLLLTLGAFAALGLAPGTAAAANSCALNTVPSHEYKPHFGNVSNNGHNPNGFSVLSAIKCDTPIVKVLWSYQFFTTDWQYISGYTAPAGNTYGTPYPTEVIQRLDLNAYCPLYGGHVWGATVYVDVQFASGSDYGDNITTYAGGGIGGNPSCETGF